ncbi:RNA polymerase sigma factor [Isosphaeraceae bacterium EP7]
MASGQWSSVVRQVNRLWTSGTAAGQTEAQLLDRFATSGDESAFETLVARHGPMVHGVCRRLLRDPNDADDAFQATFLVLARKAGTIDDREALASWLYGVARRVSARARTDASTRRRREAAANPDRPASPDAAHQAQRRELAETVQSEVDRLPASSRAVVVLCDLSGCTHEEAAARLGWPIGTVKGRHFRARNQLKDRLARRGLAPATILSALATGSEARPIVPRALLETTARAACAYATGRETLAGLAATHAIHLAQGVTKTMFTHQIQWAAAATLATALLTAGAGVVAQGVGANSKPGDTVKAPATGDQTSVSTSSTDATSSETTPQPTAYVPPIEIQLDQRRREADAALQTLKQAAESGVKVDPKDVRLWLDRMDVANTELDRRIGARVMQVRELGAQAVKSGSDQDKLRLVWGETELKKLSNINKRGMAPVKTAWDYESDFIELEVLNARIAPAPKQDSQARYNPAKNARTAEFSQATPAGPPEAKPSPSQTTTTTEVFPPEAKPSPTQTTTTTEVTKPGDAEKQSQDAIAILNAMSKALYSGVDVDVEQADFWLKRFKKGLDEQNAAKIAKAQEDVRLQEEKVRQLGDAAAKSMTADSQVELIEARIKLAELKRIRPTSMDSYPVIREYISYRRQGGVGRFDATLSGMGGMGGGMGMGMGGGMGGMGGGMGMGMGGGQINPPNLAKSQASGWLMIARRAAQEGVEVPRNQLGEMLDLHEREAEDAMAASIESFTKSTVERLESNAKLRAGRTSPEETNPGQEEARLALQKMNLATNVSLIRRNGEANKHSFDDLRGLLETGKYTPLAPGAVAKTASVPLSNDANGPDKIDGGQKPGVIPAETTPKAQISPDEGGAKDSGPIAEIGDDPASKAVAKRLATVIDASFAEPTTLDDFLKELKARTKGDSVKELNFYIESEGFPRGVMGMTGSDKKPTITLDLHDVPASLALRLALRQLSLAYFVRDGVIYITLLRDAESLEATIKGEGITRPRPVQLKK